MIFMLCFMRKFSKKTWISYKWFFFRQMHIIAYFKLVALTFSINQNSKISKILLNSSKLKSFKNELYKVTLFFVSILQSTRTLFNYQLITSKISFSKHFIFSSNFFNFSRIYRIYRETFTYNNDLHRHLRIKHLREKREKF